MSALKAAVKSRFPDLWQTMRGLRRQVRVEYKVLRQIGVRNLVRGRLWRKASWKAILPLQKPLRIPLPHGALTTIAEFLARLEADGLRFSTGGQAVYLPPDTLAASELRGICHRYPADAGVKIAREPGDVGTSRYVSQSGHSRINRKLNGDHGRLSLVANLLHLSNLGPRLYDLVELECDGTVWTAYVVQHVEGRQPERNEWQDGLGRLRSLETEGLVKVTLGNGWNNKDFRFPECNGNALVDAAGNFHYIDFQNFALDDYETFLNRTGRAAVDGTRFGAQSLLRGPALYQSIPGVGLPAQRSVEDRYAVLAKLMDETGLSVQNRLVLDVGCNLGMVMGEYLKSGAYWCHGWDRVDATRHAESLLLALGCTRFSLTGGDIQRDQRLEDDVPSFLSLDGCVISYLAIRKHVGWLTALARIPWSFLIYEGHQREGRAQLEADLADFQQMIEFRVAATGSYKDGVSDERLVALLHK